MNLQLSLKTKWFEMTKSGEKTEDYREITPYWFSRLFKDAPSNTAIRIGFCKSLKSETSAAFWNFKNGYFFDLKDFKTNTMTLGYPRSGDKEKILKLEHKGIEIKKGKPEWGAEPNTLYFVIKHGKIINNN